MEKRIGAISVRVSTDRQTEYSPDSQIKECLKYAKEHNIYVPPEHIYRDDGISGKSTEKRSDFLRMITNAQRTPKPFEVVLTYSFSRFARNKHDSVVYKHLLRNELGIDVISVTQPLPDAPESVLLESVYEGMDEQYILRLAKESLRGKVEKAGRGEHMGNAPLGYAYDKNTKTIYPSDRVKDVVFIFKEWVKQDTSIGSLTTKLNTLGIKTKRGKNWCEGSLFYLLNNPAYIGYTRFTLGGMNRDYNNPDTILAKGVHPPIIDVELWECSQNKLKEHEKTWYKYKKPSKKHHYWLKGLLKCSNCGSNLIMVERKSGTKRKPFFQCNGYNKNSCNKSHSILQGKLENSLLMKLEKIFTEKMDINIVNNQTNIDEISILKDTINKHNARLERIEFAYIDGIDTLEEYKSKKTNINSEIDRLKKELESMSTKEYKEQKKAKVYRLCEHAHKILPNPKVDFKIKEKIANDLFDHIIYNKIDNALYVTFKED